MNAAHYNRGFETGRYWKEDYRPGGPFLMRKCSPNREPPCKICAENRLGYDDWFAGFDAGIIARDSAGE